jgi:ABC-type uncharacterized transport system fused permease/ATPase subunit
MMSVDTKRTQTRAWRKLRALVHEYWWSAEKLSARLLLLAIVGPTLGMVLMNVQINEWQNSFFNSLQDKNQTRFYHELVRFIGLAAVWVVMSVYAQYLTQILQIRWRRWLTEDYLVTVAALEIEPRSRTLIQGPSGSGKSTLLRAIAGIWPFGRGTIRRPGELCALFLPQRAYFPLGTLREAMCYPSSCSMFSEAQVNDALRSVGLSHLISRLDGSANWAQQLSGADQQRTSPAKMKNSTAAGWRTRSPCSLARPRCVLCHSSRAHGAESRAEQLRVPKLTSMRRR